MASRSSGRSTRKLALLVPILAAVTGGAILFISMSQAPPQPSYNGKTLEQWLESRNSDNIRDLSAASQAAIRAMGTNALPALVHLVSLRDSTFRLKLRAMAGRNATLRKWLRTHNGERLRGAAGLEALGPIAASVVSDLIPLLGDGQTSYPAALALAAIGSPAVPALVNSTTNQNVWIRLGAIQAINFMHGVEPAIPSLLVCLSDTDSSVRQTAAIALGDVRRQPEVVVPRLIKLLDDHDSSVRQAGAVALGMFEAHAQQASSKLVELQSDPSPDVRASATIALKKLAASPDPRSSLK